MVPEVVAITSIKILVSFDNARLGYEVKRRWKPSPLLKQTTKLLIRCILHLLIVDSENILLSIHLEEDIFVRAE